MNRIRLLPEQVANQIAAGEVVERPASVVKELVENALDAQAKRINVEIQAGGRSLIRVTDDGSGMTKDDALLCLERHATSKIRVAEDLSSIATMGFRGEALPSIASVSRLSLTTRQCDAAEGTQVIIHGGKIQEVKAAGAAPGTSIEARNLFFNLPARRKFLRSDETERAHIQHYLTLAALAYPEVAFTFVQDGRLIWQLPAHPAGAGEDRYGALEQRIRSLHGSDLKLVRVSFAAPSEQPSFENAEREAPLRIWGFIGAPGLSRATREEQHLFVNRRPVENRGLNFALLEGYHTALMKGRYPVCCLFLEIDPAAVDVNIHPAKREVKFHQEWAVRRTMAEAVRAALLSYHSGPAKSPAAVDPEPAESAATQVDLPSLPAERFDFAPPSGVVTTPAIEAPPERQSEPSQEAFPIGTAPAGKPAAPPPQPALEPTAMRGPATEPISSAIPPPPPATSGPTPLLNIPLRIVGVVGRLYVVLESDRGLVLLDQHAAHERILFEQMLRRVEQGDAPSQRLLLPATVELAVRDAQFVREHLAALTRLGVGLSEFGERTFLLDALPPFVKATEPRRFVLELIDALKAAGTSANSWRLGEDTVTKTVCRHAVKANDPLAGPELQSLLDDLRRCTMPYTCPHGRPTLIEMNFRELEKKFGRTQ